MSDISLDELIKQGEELKSSLYNYKTERGIAYHKWVNKSDEESYAIWKNICQRFLTVDFGEDVSSNDFRCAVYSFESYKTPQGLQEMIGVLESCKRIPSVISNCKKCNSEKDSSQQSISISVNNTNSQRQSQEQNLAFELFVSAIDNELTGKQRKELKNYLEETQDLSEEERKQGVIEKLKRFGKDLGLNVLANIITNPQIWTNL